MQELTEPMSNTENSPPSARPEGPGYPFSAIVGLDEAKTALVLCAVDPLLGGVLLVGGPGSGKSVTARSLASVLPGDAPFIEIPLQASIDQLSGTLHRSVSGTVVRPGIVSRADGGVVYVAEVNRIDATVANWLTQVARMQTNRLSDAQVAVRETCRFVLLGSMDPGEGSLRPAIADRFGLSAQVSAPHAAHERAEIVRRAVAFDRDPAAFARSWADAERELSRRIDLARPAEIADQILEPISRLCVALGATGMRSDLLLARAAAARAGWLGRRSTTEDDLAAVAPLVLPHRRLHVEPTGLLLDHELHSALRDVLGGVASPLPLHQTVPLHQTAPNHQSAPNHQTAHPLPADAPHHSVLGLDVPASPTSVDRPASTRSEFGEERSWTAPTPVAADTQTTSSDGAAAGYAHVDLRDRDGADQFGQARDATVDAHQSPPTRQPVDPSTSVAHDGPADEHGTRSAGEKPSMLSTPLRDADPSQPTDGTHRMTPTVGPSTALDTRPTPSIDSADNVARSERIVEISLDDPDDPVRFTDRLAPLPLRRHDPAELGHLLVLCVDTSTGGSTAERIRAVRLASLAYLERAYARRDQLAVVCFSGDAADVVLRPTTSVEVARARLAEIRTAPGAPLAAGIDAAVDVAAQPVAIDGIHRPVLVLISSGESAPQRNSSEEPGAAEAAALLAADRIARRQMQSVVIDTAGGAPRPGARTRHGKVLAARMGAMHLTLPELSPESLSAALMNLTAEPLSIR